MISTPSVKRLVKELDITLGAAQQIKAIMKCGKPEILPRVVQKYINHCYHRLSDFDISMAMINFWMNGYGIEAIHNENDVVVAEYINIKKTYTSTVIYCHTSSRFKIMSYGDYVKKYL